MSVELWKSMLWILGPGGPYSTMYRKRSSTFARVYGRIGGYCRARGVNRSKFNGRIFRGMFHLPSSGAKAERGAGHPTQANFVVKTRAACLDYLVPRCVVASVVLVTKGSTQRR